MPAFNQITLVGHAGRDGELRYLASGKGVASFGLAVTRKTADAEYTDWFDVQAWDRLGEIVGQYVKKGAAVMVQGRVTGREYVGKDGEKRFSMQVTAQQVVLLGKRGETSDIPDGGPAATQAEQPTQQQSTVSQMPF